MAPAPRHLRIFLASPGDVLAEREIALQVLENLPYHPLLRGRIAVEGVAWDKRGAGAPILAGVTPQDSIARGLPLPAACDIVVVIFWARMGTPLPPSYRKADGGPYESGTEWEYENAIEAFRRDDSPYVLLYRRTGITLDPDAHDFEERRAQYGKVQRFFADPSIGGYARYDSPGRFRELLEHDLQSLIARILEKPRNASAPGATLPEPWSGSPFPGLRAFTSADAPIFFGREREIDALAARVQEHPFVAVVGASGSGKSSLVAAGVVPRLQLTAGSAGAEPWIVLELTPDRLGAGDPFASLAAAILHALPQAHEKGLTAKLRERPELLATLLPERTLVFVDQFEELFTTIPSSLRAPFVEALQRVRTIITVRADFYGHCVELPSLAHLVENSTFPLAAPGVAALFEMITRPAARAALTFEEGLPQRILDDTGQEPGALALMAYALDELYRLGLTHAAYKELGGVQGAIGKRSESVFATLNAEEQAALPRVFRELVEVDERGTATRQRAPLERVAASPAAERLVDAFTEARLLVKSRGDDGRAVVEVAHEALFRSWARLADWIRDAADDLRLLRQVRTAAVEWDRSGRRDDFLWSHERLEPVYALRDRMQVEFEDVVAAFIRPEYERLADRIRAESRDFKQRSDVERLIQIGAPAAQVLVDCLQYVSETTRNDITTALVTLGPAALPPLVAACGTEFFINRESVVETLALMKCSPGTAVLEDLIAYGEDAVRIAAMHLAVVVADAGVVPVLGARLHSRFDMGPAALALAALDDDQAFVKLTAAVGRVLPWNMAISIFKICVSGAPSTDWSNELRWAGPAGPRLVPLIAMVRHGEIPLRAAALTAAIAPMFERGFERQAIAEILAGFGDESALRIVLQSADFAPNLKRIITAAARPQTIPALVKLLDAPDPPVRERASDVIGNLVAPGPRRDEFRQALNKAGAVASLLRLADDGEPDGVASALSTLSLLRDKTSHGIFVKHATSSNSRIRRLAVEGLGRLARSSDVPLLIRSLRDPIKPVQFAAAVALHRMRAQKPAAEEALLALERIAGSASDGELKAALIGLAVASPSERLQRVLKRVRRSKAGVARRAAEKVLKRMQR